MTHQNRSDWAIGLGLVIGLALLGWLIGNSLATYREYERTVTAKGLAEVEMPANIAIWPVKHGAVGNDLTDIYSFIAKQNDAVVSFLVNQGFSADEISFSPPTVTDKLANDYSNNNNVRFRYNASQTITVYSSKIELVRSAQQRIGELGKTGIAITANDYDTRVEYLFTGLNDLKPDMIATATQNARSVAQKFAGDSDSRLGKIKSARQGQFSISDRDSNNPHIKKVRVVSTIEYYLVD